MHSVKLSHLYDQINIFFAPAGKTLCYVLGTQRWIIHEPYSQETYSHHSTRSHSLPFFFCFLYYKFFICVLVLNLLFYSFICLLLILHIYFFKKLIVFFFYLKICSGSHHLQDPMLGTVLVLENITSSSSQHSSVRLLSDLDFINKGTKA